MERSNSKLKLVVGVGLLVAALIGVHERNSPIRNQANQSGLQDLGKESREQLKPTTGSWPEAQRESESETVRHFSDWVQTYTKSTPQVRAEQSLLAEGESLAVKRRAILKKLMETDPRQALSLAIPPEPRRELPEAVTRHLEERVDGHGFWGV